MYRAERCANTEALRAYEREQDKADMKMDAIDKATDEVVNEVEKALKRISYDYDFDYSCIKEMFILNAKEML